MRLQRDASRRQLRRMHPDITAGIAVGVGTLVLASAAARACAWTHLQRDASRRQLGRMHPDITAGFCPHIHNVAAAGLSNNKNCLSRCSQRDVSCWRWGRNVYSSSSSERSLKFPANGSARERAGTENGPLIFETGLRFMAGVGTCMDREDDATKSGVLSFGEAYPLSAAFNEAIRAC